MAKQSGDYSMMGAGIAIGMAIGVAIGVATESLAVWIGIGLCIGIAFGLALSDGDKGDGDSDEGGPAGPSQAE